jgi:hypothetical protein
MLNRSRNLPMFRRILSRWATRSAKNNRKVLKTSRASSAIALEIGDELDLPGDMLLPKRELAVRFHKVCTRQWRVRRRVLRHNPEPANSREESSSML